MTRRWRKADSNSLGPPQRDLEISIEPKVLVTEAVVDAVDHHGHPFDLRVPTRRLTGVEDHRPGAVLGQSPFDFPYQPLAFLFVGFDRLLVDQFVDFRTAIARVVALCHTDVI